MGALEWMKIAQDPRKLSVPGRPACWHYQNNFCLLTIRRSGMLRSYKIGSRPFDTFARCVFLRLARSCRVVEKFDKNHRFFMIFCRSGPEKRSIGSDFSATRQDLGKRRKMVSANVLNFMPPRLQRLSPSERRVLLSQRSDFAEK